MTALQERLVAARLLVDELSEELIEIERSTAESPDDEHDPEGSTIGYERASVTGLLERTRTEVVALEAAVDREAQGTYGLCGNCGSPIGGERLEALPATDRCVRCATLRR